jgi:hypothetical protein
MACRLGVAGGEGEGKERPASILCHRWRSRSRLLRYLKGKEKADVAAGRIDGGVDGLEDEQGSFRRDDRSEKGGEQAAPCPKAFELPTDRLYAASAHGASARHASACLGEPTRSRGRHVRVIVQVQIAL